MNAPRVFGPAAFLLFAGLFISTSLAAGQQPSSPARVGHAPDRRSRLADAAKDPRLAAWQRDLMRAVAQTPAEAGAIEVAMRPGGLAARLATATADDGVWIGIPPPSGRYGHTAIHDPLRDRMVVFGGFDDSERDDVWSLSLTGSPAWTTLAPAGSPPSGRDGHTAVYDPVRDRMVVFGGFDIGARNDVWTLSFAGTPAWSELTVTGSPPPARYAHTAIYDPVGDRMVVFGGVTGNFSYLSDVWALSLSGDPVWSELTPAGAPPTARGYHAAVYDPVRGRMLTFGGYDGGFCNDVWSLSLSGSTAWAAMAPAGAQPTARHSQSATYDPAHDRMMVFGGFDGDVRNDLWALSLSGNSAWAVVAPAGPVPRRRDSHVAILDTKTDRMIVFGGYDLHGQLGDAWALSCAGIPTWSELTPAWSPPTRLVSGSVIHDPLRDRMLVFGGLDDTLGCRNDVWALSLPGRSTWTKLSPTGGPPPAREAHTAVYDPSHDRMLVFGGRDRAFHTFNDVWELTLAGSPAWHALDPAGGPPLARYGHSAIGDPVRDRMLVFGGNAGAGLRNDVWALSLSGSPVWTMLTPSGSPPPARTDHTATYDPAGDRMVVFGGSTGTPRNDVWSLSLAGSPEWSVIVPAGTPPAPRMGHTAIHDALRHRMVVFGGVGGRSPLDDTWALSLLGSPEWSALTPVGTAPTARNDHTAIADPVRDRMVVFGGYSESMIRNDVSTLKWGGVVSVAHDLPGRPRLGPPRPNPSRRETVVELELGEPERVIVDVLDVQGRLVGRIADGVFATGRHAFTWVWDEEGERALEAGVYFIRMRTNGAQETRRTVRIR